jgi:hypothetical protein
LSELRDGKQGDQGTRDRAAEAAAGCGRPRGPALQQSATAHHRAAELHRQVADLLEALGHTDRAEEHRRLAVVDDAEGDAGEGR